MTFLAAWKDPERIVLCADTAVTSGSVLATAQSSFGEAHLNTQTRVEEAALKLCRVSPHVLAGVVGDANPAFAFLDRVHDQLVHGFPEGGLRNLLGSLERTAEGSFGLAFGHLVEGHPSLTFFTSTGGVSNLDDMDSAALLSAGSLPEHLRRLVKQVSTATGRDLPRDVARIAVLSFVQSLGVHDYLMPVGVGGAFFMAFVDRGGVNWQPDVNFILYPPGVYGSTPTFTERDKAEIAANLPVVDSISYVRTLVRDDCGLAVTSMGSPSARAFASPSCPHVSSAEAFERFVRSVLPSPFRGLEVGRFFAFISKAYRKVVLLARATSGNRGPAFAFEHCGDNTYFELLPDLVRCLELPPRNGFAELVVALEDANSGAKIWGVDIVPPVD